MGQIQFGSYKYTLLCLVLLACLRSLSAQSEHFHEELTITPLNDGKIHTFFQFTTQTPWSSKELKNEQKHFNLFPKSIGQLIQKFEVEELHLSFTQGRWWQDKWGYPTLSSPTGVELWTWFDELTTYPLVNRTNSQRVDDLWRGLSASLSGLSCSSLEQMKITTTASPHFSFQPSITHNHKNYDLVRYSILPREAVCTENLTPWLKLLPCGSKAGIGSLINPLRLYDVHYHSMSIHILKKTCNQGSDPNCSPSLELKQTLSVVFDPKQENWSFDSLFGRRAIDSCPLATKSLVSVQLRNSTKAIAKTTIQNPATPSNTRKSNEEHVLEYDLKQLKSLELKANTQFVSSARVVKDTVVPLTIQRYFTGYGQEFGGISVEISNLGNEPATFTYFEMIPWFLRIYFHTLKLYVNGSPVDPLSTFVDVRLIPAELRSTPSTIEFKATIPAHTTWLVTYEFEKAFLHWTEHPPDANRGFDIGSAAVTFVTPSSLTPQKIYSEGLLASLPTPDFSMPYNVITLTGTIFALFFGSMFNLLLRRMKFLDKVDNDFVSRRPIARLLRTLLSFIDAADE